MLNVVIFAAGVGSRLGPLTADRPKALLPLGNGGTVLDHTLQLLTCSGGIGTIHVVGGHKFSVLEQHVRTGYGHSPIKLVENHTYNTVNNIGSFALAANVFRAGGTLLFNSDIVYHPRILATTIERIEAEPQQSFLVIDGGVLLDHEEMKVVVDPTSGRVTQISKAVPPSRAVGEYIGIAYLAQHDGATCVASAQQLLDCGHVGLYYEDAIAQCLDYVCLQVHSTAGHWWTEIDTKQDYEKALDLAKGVAG